MRHFHTVEQVRRAEVAAMERVPDGALMQRAAAGLAAVCAGALGRVYGSRVLVLVGPGDNGGDALYAGARLAARGAAVAYVPLAERLHGQAVEALRRAGGRAVTAVEATNGVYDLVLDGIVGIGGRPGLRPSAGSVVTGLCGDPFVVAVDVPSGVGVDTGELPEGAYVHADLTVTFGTHKRCHVLAPAAFACGDVTLVDIGLDEHLPEAQVQALDDRDALALLPSPGPADHKYTRGVLGVRAGSARYPGAGLLATAAARATGLCGMIRYVGGSQELVRSRLPEVVTGDGRVQAYAVGSGLDTEAADVLAEVARSEIPTVVDADGLAHLSPRPGFPCVMTPHAGELARLLEVERDAVEAEPLTYAQRAADCWQAVVLLKGARTVVAAPDGRVRVNTTGTPWLATAGSGDVLTGVVGALLASGLDPFDAACVGAWWHGLAGSWRAGPLHADDLVERLRPALASASADVLPHWKGHD